MDRFSLLQSLRLVLLNHVRDLAISEGKLASGWLGPRDVFRVYDWPGEEGIHQSFGNARPTSAAFLLQSPMVRDTGA